MERRCPRLRGRPALLGSLRGRGPLSASSRDSPLLVHGFPQLSAASDQTPSSLPVEQAASHAEARQVSGGSLTPCSQQGYPQVWTTHDSTTYGDATHRKLPGGSSAISTRCSKYKAETYPTQRARLGVKGHVENSFATRRGGLDVDKREAAILLRHPDCPPKIRDLHWWRQGRDDTREIW
jgi:hypothetical protein